MSDQTDEQDPTTREAPASSDGDPGAPGGTPDGTDPKTYDEDYVRQLRDEAAAHRVRAKRADEAESRLRVLAIAAASAGVLQDPTDLAWSDELADDDGYPDHDKIRAAAEELVATKPHLGRPSGDIGQGRHTKSDDAVSLTSLLRAGA